MDDGRLSDPPRGGGQGRGTPRVRSHGSAPGTPPPPCAPPRPDGSQAVSAHLRGSRGQASGEKLPGGQSGPRGSGTGNPEPSEGHNNGNDRDRGVRARGGGHHDGREEEQRGARLTRGAAAVLGEVMRRVVDDPTLRCDRSSLANTGTRPGPRPVVATPTPTSRCREQGGTARHGLRATARVTAAATTERADATPAIASTKGAADRAPVTIVITDPSRTAGTGQGRDDRPPQLAAAAPRPPPHPVGSTPAIRRTEAGPARGGCAAAEVTKVREGLCGTTLGQPPHGNAATLSGTTSPRARVTTGRSHTGTAATGVGLLPPAPGGVSPSGKRYAAMGTDCGGAISRSTGGLETAAPVAVSSPSRRQPIYTYVSQEQQDAERGQSRAPAARREDFAPAPARVARAAAPHAPRDPRPSAGQLYGGHDVQRPCPATCTACFFWHGDENVFFRCGHHPDAPSSSWCDVCRFYFEVLDERNGRPQGCLAGSPRPSPSLGDRARIATAPTPRTDHTTSSCKHTLDRPGPDCPSCTARGALRRAEGGRHAAGADARAPNRSWSPPDRHNVMTGQFGRRDRALESAQRQRWLDAILRVTGVNSRELRPLNNGRPRRGHRYVPLAGNEGDSLGGGSDRRRAHRVRRTTSRDGRWVRDMHPRFEARNGRDPADGDAILRWDARRSRRASALFIVEHDEVSVASSPPGDDEAHQRRDAQADERTRDPRSPDGRRPQRRDMDNDGDTRAPRGDGDGDGDDDDDDDGNGARRGAEAASQPSGQGPAPGAVTGPQGVRGPRATTGLRRLQGTVPSPQPKALSTRAPTAPRRRGPAAALFTRT